MLLLPHSCLTYLHGNVNWDTQYCFDIGYKIPYQRCLFLYQIPVTPRFNPRETSYVLIIQQEWKWKRTWHFTGKTFLPWLNKPNPIVGWVMSEIVGHITGQWTAGRQRRAFWWNAVGKAKGTVIVIKPRVTGKLDTDRYYVIDSFLVRVALKGSNSRGPVTFPHQRTCRMNVPFIAESHSDLLNETWFFVFMCVWRKRTSTVSCGSCMKKVTIGPRIRSRLVILLPVLVINFRMPTEWWYRQYCLLQFTLLYRLLLNTMYHREQN